MAKLSITFNENELIKELEFRGKKYEYKMVHTEIGAMSNNFIFSHQVEQDLPLNDYTYEVYEALGKIDIGDEAKMYEGLQYLCKIE